MSMKKIIISLLLLVQCFFGFSQSVDGSLKTLTATGTDTYVITDPLPASYDPKERFIVSFTNACSSCSSATLNRSGLGAKAIKWPGAVALAAGDITAGERKILSYNGTYYQVIGTKPGGAFWPLSGTGVFSNHVTINGSPSFDLTINSRSLLFESVSSFVSITTNNGIILGTDSLGIDMGNAQAFFIDNSHFPRGIQYNADYSTYFFPRSLIDKGYSDSHFKGLTFTNSPSSGNVPTFNGTNWTFSTPGPAGSNQQVQFNNSGAFGAATEFTWNNASKELRVTAGTSYSNMTNSLLEVVQTGLYDNFISSTGFVLQDISGNNSVSLTSTGITSDIVGGSHIFTMAGIGTGTTFRTTPTTTRAGFNFGSLAGDPVTTLNNGDVWYNSSTNKFRGRQNGTSVDLVGSSGTVTSVSITAGTNITQSGSPITGSGAITINAIPSGSNGQLQFNSSGAFGGNSNLTHSDGATLNDLSVGNNSTNAQSVLYLQGDNGGTDATFQFTVNEAQSDLSNIHTSSINSQFLPLVIRTAGTSQNIYIIPTTTGTSYLVLKNIPTANPCGTAPSGTIWSNSNVLTICP